MITSIQFGLFLLVFLAWLGLSLYVVLNRLRHERGRQSLGRVMAQLGHSKPLLLTANTTARPALANPLITQLPKPVVYRAASDVAPYTPAAAIFARHALAHWGSASVFAAASKTGPGVDRWQRISALSILARARADGIHELLFDALQDKDTDVASSAAVFLGQLQDRRAAEMLVTALRLQLYLPSFIARQLDNFTIAFADLLEPLLDVNSTHARYWAVTLLARHGGEEKRHAQKIARLADDPDPALRKAVAQALGILGASDEALVVLKLLYDDVAYVRVHAVKALARFNWPDFTDSLVAMLADPEWRVRLAAREALAAMEKSASPDASATPAATENLVETDLRHLDNLHLSPFGNLSEKTPVHARSEGRRS